MVIALFLNLNFSNPDRLSFHFSSVFLKNVTTWPLILMFARRGSQIATNDKM